MTSSAAPAVNWDALPLLLTPAEALVVMRRKSLNGLYIMARQHRIAHVHYGRDLRFDRDALRRGDTHSSHTHDPAETQQTSQSDPLHLPSRRPSPRRLDSAPAAGR